MEFYKNHFFLTRVRSASFEKHLCVYKNSQYITHSMQVEYHDILKIYELLYKQ